LIICRHKLSFLGGNKMLKRFVGILIMMSLLVSLASCADNKRINGVMYETYGLFNKEEVRDPKIATNFLWEM